MRRRLARLAPVALATAAFGAVPAEARVAERCDDLRGATKVETDQIKVVQVRVRDRRLRGKRAYGCVLPRGRVFRIGVSGNPKRGRLADHTQVSYDLGAHAGRFLVVERAYGDGLAQEQSRRAVVMDLRTGRNRRFYEGGSGYGCAGHEEQSYSRRTPPVDRVVLGRSGAFAVLYADRYDQPAECFPHKGSALLRGFPPSGPPVQLDLAPADAIPPGSLAVSGSTVTWTNAGSPRSEEL